MKQVRAVPECDKTSRWCVILWHQQWRPSWRVAETGYPSEPDQDNGWVKLVLHLHHLPKHGRSYHRAWGACAPLVSGLDFLKWSCQREIYKLNGVGHLRFPSASHI